MKNRILQELRAWEKEAKTEYDILSTRNESREMIVCVRSEWKTIIRTIHMIEGIEE